MWDFDDSGDKTHRETRDINWEAISVANEYDVTDSPLTLVAWTTYAIDTSWDVAEVFLLPVWTDIQLWNDNPVTDHDLIRDGSKESVWCLLFSQIFIKAVWNGLVYIRRLKL
jgi:hypothetical protein